MAFTLYLDAVIGEKYVNDILESTKGSAENSNDILEPTKGSAEKSQSIYAAQPNSITLPFCICAFFKLSATLDSPLNLSKVKSG